MFSDHPKARYYFELGRFIHHFARTEGAVLNLLWFASGVKDDVARVVFAGVRVATAKDLINRSFKVRGITPDKTLAAAFAQLTVLNSARNLMLHYDPDIEPGFTYSRSNRTQRIPGTEEQILLTPEVLSDMTEDLATIDAAIRLARMPELPAKDGLRVNAARPWQYKPTQPSQPKKPPRREPKEGRARPPRS